MACQEEVKVTYQPERWQPSGRLLVLDSSFNPPTLAHQALMDATIGHFGPSYFSAALLLFSTHNADKGTASDTHHRLNMMTIVARAMTTTLPTAVATTHYPRFIDKAEALVRVFGTHTTPYFIMGYDTVVRFLNPVYYEPTPLAKAIAPFFDKASLVCVDREGYGGGGGGDGDDEDRFWQTSAYRGKMTRVRLSDPAVARLSSTLARQQVAAGAAATIEAVVNPGVAEYIRAHHLYGS